MNIELHFIKTDRSPIIEDIIKEKIELIRKKYDWITNAAVFVKGEQHKNGKNCCCEVRLSVPGPQLYAETTETTYNKAVHEVFRELDVQLRKRKDKMYAK